ncbi:hypothetical protein [Hymenobacter ruricola]|uniref:Macroglobulin domain-containing protein n=1 Tax=Hymenobacter ruricola TaxID=2791023 RepID=A0ABS0I9X3_9BACT|nr:hypothetical protein [Hymenobacter ruricola]MBF9223756.1 hypothetical protein [Hymenobacter ruricola]
MRSHFLAAFSVLRPARSAGLALALSLAGPAAQAQFQGFTPTDSLSPAGRLARYEQRTPHEKLYLHLDRPVYLSGETMWFKVYAVDGTAARPLTLSSVAYVEVLDAQHQPVLQGKVALRNATGQGSFVLPSGLGAGTYTVRAYTSWMKNFGPDFFFHAAVTVINPAVASGALSQDSASYEAQFFPEGGNLVRGLTSTVAVKVTDKAGKGIAGAQGKVLNPSGAVVATFQTQRLGLGTFTLTPTAGPGAYTAEVALGKKLKISRKLPRVFEQGYVLHLDDTGPDQLAVTVSATTTLPETVFLLGHSRQQAAVALSAQLVNGRAQFVVSKAQLLEGVSHLTLFNGAQQPVCERLYFQRPTHALAVAVQPDKAQYTTRDKVLLQVSGADQQTPVAANLSMAVYRLDSLTTTQATAIDRYLWLTSDLKGAVENPDYYFTATGPEAAAAADNLMLTQGWSRFRWENVLAPAPPPFEFMPEPNGLVVQAQLLQAGTGRPRVGTLTYLASPSRITRLSTSLSDAKGRVKFEVPYLTGPRDIMLQTDAQQDTTCQITVLNPFSERYAEAVRPPFGLSARFQHDYAKRYLQAQVQNVFSGRYRNRYAAERVDSTSFFGRPDELYYLDKYTRFKVMEEVLREYVPGVLVRIQKGGYRLMVADKINQTVLSAAPMVLLDGVPVFNINHIMAINPLKIQRLEVMDSRYFHGLALYNGLVSFTTYKGDLEGFALDARVLVQQYEGVQRQREFYAPRYETDQEKTSRLPDLRNLLYWNPEISTTGAEARKLEFYTGDQAGRYLVVTQGLSSTGLAGSSRVVLEVKPAL